MELEQLLKSSEYKTMKKTYEKEYFKLFGKYCKVSASKGVQEKSVSEMFEKFKNKKVKIEFIEEVQTKKGTTISTKKNISKSFFDVWSQDETIPEYDDIVFECNKKLVDKTDYNMFDGFQHFCDLKEKDINLEPVFEHIRSLTNYFEVMFNYMLDWLAQLVQFPELLPDTAIIIISQEGVGKDLFAEFIEAVIGSKYFGVTEKLDQVCGKFNSTLGGKLFYVINETNPSDSAQRKENIKNMITAKKLQIEEKYKTPIKCSNFCRFMFFSNRVLAFPIEEGSRRPVIIEASKKYLPANYGKDANAKHFTALSQIFKNEDTQYCFLRYLLKRDISKFNPRNYEKSKLHDELERGSIDPLVMFMYKYITKASKEKKGEIRVKTSEMLQLYVKYSKKNQYQFTTTPKKLIAEMSFLLDIHTTKISVSHFVIDIKTVKLLLKTKYHCHFPDAIDEDNDYDDGFDDGFKNAEKQIEIKHVERLEEENKQLKIELEKLKKQLLKVENVEEKKKVLQICLDELDELDYFDDEDDNICKHDDDDDRYDNKYDFDNMKTTKPIQKNIVKKNKNIIVNKKRKSKLTDAEIKANEEALNNMEDAEDLKDVVDLF
mgnify:FL=1